MNFKFQYILLVIIALCMGACATQHGGGAGSRYDGLTASSSPDARFIIVNESVPPLKTFMSGRSALDDLVKLGSQVEDSPSRVRLPNLAFVIEKAIY